MIHPKRDSLIALIVALVALAAFGWGLRRLLVFGEDDVPGSFAVGIGAVVGVISLLVLVNFYWALRIARRMERGEGVIARWTVPAEMIPKYLALEAERRIDRSRWRPRPGTAAEILFSDDAVLASGRLHSLASNGLQVFTHVQLIRSKMVLIEFQIREVTISSSLPNAGKFQLRIPVPPGTEALAEQVIAHYLQVRADAPADPRYWRLRRKIGLGILFLSIISVAAGYVLAEHTDWNDEETAGTVAIGLMITGVMFGIMALFLTLVASAALRRAGRQGIRPAR